MRPLIALGGALGLVFAILALLPSLADAAACTGSGLTWNCDSTATRNQVQAAVDSATDGATITFAAGTYHMPTMTLGGVDNWMAKFYNTKGITVQCATAPLTVGAATVNPCLVTGISYRAIFGSDRFAGVNTKLYRVTGFTFDMAGGGTGLGAVRWDSFSGGTHEATVTQIRVDHNTFQNGVNGARLSLLGSGSEVFHGYGVYDHNLVTNQTMMGLVDHLGSTISNPITSQFGTANNLFIEDNTLTFTTMGNGSVIGCMEGLGGSAYVVRHNTSLNCVWGLHGVTGGGGPANIEFYENTVVRDAGAASGYQDGHWGFHHQGSGESILFNNRFTASGGKDPISALHIQHYRSAPATSTNTTLYPWQQCDGIDDEAAPWVNVDGDRSPIETYRGYPCFRQPGRDNFGNLKPVYVWNNYWTDDLTQVSFVMGGIGGSPNYAPQHIQVNRDSYVAVSASAQTSATSPFTGATGMGFGTLARRPTTCTPTSEALDAGNGGVGYFATDTGAQGTLYRCSSTNTWTVHYTPYPYPHPLVSDVPATPVNTVPGAQTVVEDTALPITGISVADADGDLATIQLAALHGTNTVSLAGGATVSAGTNGSADVTLAGTQAQLNTAVGTLSYQGVLDYVGTDLLTVTSRDAISNTDIDTVAITVTAVAAPAAPTGVHLTGLATGVHRTLIWAPNAETDLASYEVYQGFSPGNYPLTPIATITIASAAAAHSPMTQKTLSLRTTGEHCWRIKAVNSGNGKSPPSAEVCSTVTGMSARTARTTNTQRVATP